MHSFASSHVKFLSRLNESMTTTVGVDSDWSFADSIRRSAAGDLPLTRSMTIQLSAISAASRTEAKIVFSLRKTTSLITISA